MDMLKRISGVILIVMAFVVAVHTVVEPLYHGSTTAQPYSPVWDTLNPLMVLTIALGLIFAFIRKRGVDGEGGAAVTREYFAANTLFFGFIFVGILFLWNWFNLLNPAFAAIGSETVSLVWIIIDATLPLLSGAMGIFLLRGDGDG
jgi:hypothetical protein